MTGILKVDTIQSSGGTTGLTIDSNGVLKSSTTPYVCVDFGGSAAYVSKTGGDVVDFGNIVFSQGGNHWNTSTYKWTCPTDGLYYMYITMIRNGADDNSTGTDFYQNGTRVFRQFQADRGFSATAILPCSANDVLHWQFSNTESYYEGTGTNRYSYGIIAKFL